MQIFISYSRTDGEFAEIIYRRLKKFNYDVFIDINSIRSGEPWTNSIESNISKCDIFVVILTHNSLRSSDVENEVLQAQRQNKIIISCINCHPTYNERHQKIIELIKWTF